MNPLPAGDFRLLWVGQAGSALGDAITAVALAFAIFGIGGSAADLGVTLSVLALARLASVLVGGTVADRFGRRAVAIGADLARGLVQGLVAVALVMDAARPWHFVCAAVVVGLAGGFFAPAMTGLIRDTVPEHNRQKANAWISLARSVAGIAGPAVGGVVLATFGVGQAFVLDAASFIVSAGALLLMRSAPPVGSIASPPDRGFKAGVRVLTRLRWVWHSIAVFAVANLASGAFFVAGPAMAASHYEGAQDWGLMLSAAGIGGLVGGGVAIRFRIANPLRTAFLIALAIPAQLLVLGLALPLPLVLLAGAITVGARTVTNALWDTSIQTDVPESFVSRISSYDWFVSLALAPIGLAAAGPLVALLGAQQTLVLAGAISLGAYAVAQFDPTIKNPRQERAQDADANEVSGA